MVSAISGFSPISYLSSIKPASLASAVGTPGISSLIDSDETQAAVTPANPVKPSANALGLSSDVLDVLQGSNSSSDLGSVLSTLLGGSGSSGSDPVSALLGGGSSSGGDILSSLLGGGSSSFSSDTFLSGVYNTLLSNSSDNEPLKAAIAAAQQQRADGAASTNPLNDILASRNSAINAYNQTLQQATQTILAQGEQLIA